MVDVRSVVVGEVLELGSKDVDLRRDFGVCRDAKNRFKMSLLFQARDRQGYGKAEPDDSRIRRGWKETGRRIRARSQQRNGAAVRKTAKKAN